jgi:hypothetical protein
MLAATTLTASMLFAAPAAEAGTGSVSGQVAQLRAQIRTNRTQAVARARWVGVLLPAGHSEQNTTDVGFLSWMLSLWHQRSMKYGHILLHRLGVYGALLCIHRHEGAWNAYSSAGPYYGGLQMDTPFMAHYGPKFLARFGDARHWMPALQVATAYRAVMSVGYTPWPVSRLACGV